MKTHEIADFLKNQHPNLVTNDTYTPPTQRCNRWILLCGPVYKDKGFRSTLFADVTKMYDWANDHAKRTWSSRSAQQEAKEYFPEWIVDVDPNNDDITLLDENQRGFLQDYKLDFVCKGWVRIWCHDCQKFHSEITKNDHDHEKIGKTSRWVEEWHCPEGHLLYSEPQEIRWIIR